MFLNISRIDGESPPPVLHEQCSHEESRFNFHYDLMAVANLASLSSLQLYSPVEHNPHKHTHP